MQHVACRYLYLFLLPLSLWAGCATTNASKGTTTPPRVHISLLATGSDALVTRTLAKKSYLELEIVDPDAALRATASADPRSAHCQAAQQALQLARTDYRNLQFTEAVTRLNRAQTDLATVASTPGDFQLLAQLSLQRGLNHLALTDLASASQAFITAFHLGYPGPRPGEHPPEVEAKILQAQSQRAGATTGGLTLKAEPEGARVWIDGQDRGASPVTVQVPPGLHHVRVERTGHKPRALFHQVTAGKVERLEIYLKTASTGETARQLLEAKERGAALHQQDPLVLGRALGEDRALLVVSSAEGQQRARAIWTGRRPASPVPGEPCTGTSPRQLADCLGPRLYQLSGGQPLESAKAVPRGTQKPLYKRWWFWTLVAAGAAGAAGAGVGIYYGTRDNGGTNIDIVSSKR